MKPDKLHRFLHALNLGEQRMCKKAVVADTSKWAAQRKKLFTALMLQQTYDVAKLSKAIGDAAYLEELPTEKNRMYKRLLHAVLEHRASSEDNIDPMEKLRESQLLFSLALRAEAIATAEEGLKRAKKLVDPVSEMLLRNHLRQMLKVQVTLDDLPRLADNEERLVHAANRTLNLLEYHVAADKVGRLRRRFGATTDHKVLNELEELMLHPLLADWDEIWSIRAMWKFNLAHAKYYDVIGDLRQAASYLDFSLDKWHSFPQGIAHEPGQYVTAVSDLIGVLVRLDSMEQIPALLLCLENVPITSRNDRVLAFCRFEASHQLYNIKCGRPNAVLAREKWVMEQIDHYGQLISDSFRLTLCYNIGIAHLMMGNNGKALAMFSHIRDMGECYARLDLQGLARLFRLLLLLELPAHDNIDHYLRNSRRFFKAHHPSYPMEKAVYTWLEEGCQHPEGAMSKTRLLALHGLLAHMEEQRLIGAEELRKWALSRAEGIPMHSVTDSRNGDSDSMRQICA